MRRAALRGGATVTRLRGFTSMQHRARRVVMRERGDVRRLSGRPARRLIDPNVYLARERDGLAPKAWILPGP
jgi:vitamin K-dependent gamma-carboxylase